MASASVEAVSANDENDLSDANRSSTSILGSLERLVESSFKPTASVSEFAQQVLAAKRAFGAAFESGPEEMSPATKKVIVDEAERSSPAPWPRSSSNSLASSSAELKFLKYSELAKELSSGR